MVRFVGEPFVPVIIVLVPKAISGELQTLRNPRNVRERFASVELFRLESNRDKQAELTANRNFCTHWESNPGTSGLYLKKTRKIYSIHLPFESYPTIMTSVTFRPSAVKSFHTARALFSAMGRRGTRIPAGGRSHESSSQPLRVELLLVGGGRGLYCGSTGGFRTAAEERSFRLWVPGTLEFK